MKLGLDNRFVDEENLVNNKVKEMHQKLLKGWWNNPVRWFMVLLALSLLLSYIYILRLSEGGEITFFSMLILCLIGYIVNPKAGLFAAFLFALIRYGIDYVFSGKIADALNVYGGQPELFMEYLSILSRDGYHVLHKVFADTGNPDFVLIVGDIFDYFIGYTLLGLYGFAEALTVQKKGEGEKPRKVFSLQGAFLFVVSLRFIESVVSTLVFYIEPQVWIVQLIAAAAYSFIYVFIEGLLSFFVFSIPQVVNVLLFVRTVAHTEYNERIYKEY